MLFRKKTQTFLMALLVMFSHATFANDNKLNISVAVSKEILSIYKSWTSVKPCWDVTNFHGKHSNRGAAELIMLCKAFHMSGADFEFDFHPTQNYAKALLLSRQKQAHIPGESVWKNQADSEFFYTSPPTLRVGEFEKGIFTVKSHPMMKAIHSVNDLNRFRGVTLSSWYLDWRLLRQLTNRLVRAKSPFAVHDMIEKNRADFTLAEFNREMRLDLNGIVLLPVPHVKVAIKESRHFIVRKGMEDSSEIIAALTKGLTKMRELKMIKRTYIDAGFINPDVANWKTLTPQSNRQAN